MKNFLKKKSIIAVLSLLSICLICLIYQYSTKTFLFKPNESGQSKQVENAEETKTESELVALRSSSGLLKVLDSDYVIGNQDAPVLIIEYASISCPHCAYFFREGFDKLKDEYINTGKVKFVFRHFPLNQQALVASMLLDCKVQSDKNVDNHYNFLRVLFKTQDSWAFDPKFAEKLEAIANLDGMSSSKFKSCINNESLRNKILLDRMEAIKSLRIESTPVFFINEEISEGYVDYQSMKKIIDKKMLNSSKSAK